MMKKTLKNRSEKSFPKDEYYIHLRIEPLLTFSKPDSNTRVEVMLNFNQILGFLRRTSSMIIINIV